MFLVLVEVQNQPQPKAQRKNNIGLSCNEERKNKEEKDEKVQRIGVQRPMKGKSFGLLTILDVFPFHLIMYSEKVSPTPCLVVSKSLRVISIIVLKMNWNTNNSTSLFHTLVLLGSKL